MSIVRGCGERVEGGVYACCSLSPSGIPIEFMFADPPQPIEPKAYGLRPRGVRMIEFQGRFHLMDWIGAVHYPNAPDFLEEARRFGVSRRIPRSLDTTKLTRESKLLLVHPRGRIAGGSFQHCDCPKEKCRSLPIGLGWSSQNGRLTLLPQQADPHGTDPTCLGELYKVLHPGETRYEGGMAHMPSFSYVGELGQADFEVAIIMVAPITDIQVVGVSEESRDLALKIASSTEIPVNNVED